MGGVWWWDGGWNSVVVILRCGKNPVIPGWGIKQINSCCTLKLFDCTKIIMEILIPSTK